MSLVFVRPGHAMGIGNNKLALYAPLIPEATSPASLLTEIVFDTQGWWDASSLSGLLGPNNVPVAAWNSSCAALIDLSGMHEI